MPWHSSGSLMRGAEAVCVARTMRRSRLQPFAKKQVVMLVMLLVGLWAGNCLGFPQCQN